MARTIDGVVNEVLRMLEEVRLGTVVAVWPDGSVSSHRSLGFRRRVTPEGVQQEPVTSFVRASELQSAREIQEKLRRTLTHGAPPSSP
jgi:hypothetical protein